MFKVRKNLNPFINDLRASFMCCFGSIVPYKGYLVNGFKLRCGQPGSARRGRLSSSDPRTVDDFEVRPVGLGSEGVSLFVKRIIAHVYESYKGRDKEWESHAQPFVLLSHWSGKVLTKVTASETTDVVEFIADTLKTIKRAMQYKHHIEATYIHCLATNVLRYRLITVDTVDSWK
ncbi:hypothetical protein HPB47_006205 [Ixodes persulcatus]|uniref:Uncharacterized protein n=1 Tax=Ixodes persulcatus TaxID=34615 RepID=A0AC60PAX6_IXOPE|nr:hypothetical protein HPB47_006205 [Ixodes persulcatus]